MHSTLLQLPPLDPLRGFVAAARHLSFTRAADELCLTQSAISRQVQTLEGALGVALFVRGVRSLQLTAEGARLAAAAEGWLAEYGRLADALRQPGERPVTVTASIGISALWLVPRLREFQQRHPATEVRIAAGNRIVDLAREDIDLALRYCADHDAPPRAIKLFGETVLPVGHPSIAAGLELTAETLPQLTLLDYDEPGYPWLGWEHWLAAIGLDGVRPRARIGFSHYDQLIHAAATGHGLAIGRAVLIDPLIEDGRLMPVGARQVAMPGRGFWLVPAPRPMRPEVERFADWVVESAGAV
ncbi:LysR family transcriptional regulator [Thauera sp. CAU 1555]|jgi:DNA-binding transcriptional LysR family regulator|uniref:LysR family transcriptional regulator n=1 Tax=Thauera sedimentorum TaxID=2767595 RepID=A0ABR9BBZ6_9RHOO|nr:LysR substrate-binding domain-containing protein [Thauera sedimentorum]MBC9072807.1 LysR family transcriptional regulator [Thauera sedimentorum]MBD8503726.1 LysR family transcriptional regulator [Thauera sedimentorum]